MSKTHLLKSLFRYLLVGKTKYYLHSPLVYQFAEDVLSDKRKFYAFDQIEDLRRQLLRSSEKLTVTDFGAGSHSGKGKERKIKEICKSMAVRPRYGRLLFRLANHWKSERILELGTSLGIGTAYLAKARTSAEIISLEGCPAIAAEAQRNLESLGLENVELIVGDFANTLPQVLQKSRQSFDLVYLDGNHRYEPTLQYWELLQNHLQESSVVIMDDIHWSIEMERAWEEIKGRTEVTFSIDLFQFGLLFFQQGIAKEHFSLYY